MLLGRVELTLELHDAGVLRSVVLAGDGLLDIRQALLERAPREGNGLNLDVLGGGEAALDNGVLPCPVLVRRIIEEEVASELEASTERPGPFSQQFRQILGRRRRGY